MLSGEADPGISTSSPAHWVYDDTYGSLAPAVDPTEATRLLSAAGWSQGPDGVLRNSTDEELRFAIMVVSTDQQTRDLAAAVQAQLRTIGIAVDIRPLEQNTLWAILDGVPAPDGSRRRDFQADISSFIESTTKKIDEGLFHSRSRNNPLSATGFTSPRTDVLLDSIDVITDRSLARPLWQEYHEILIDQAPLVVLHYPRVLFAHRETLRDVQITPRGFFGSVGQWWLSDN